MGLDLPLKILFISPYPPSPIRTRPYNFIKSLVFAGHRLTVATPWEDEADLNDLLAFRDRLDGLITKRIRRSRSARNCLRAAITGYPMQAWYSWSPGLARRLLQEISDSGFDVIHTEHLRGVQYGVQLIKALGRQTSPKPVFVWDSVDCISGLCRQAARQSATLRHRLIARLESRRTARQEADALRLFDRVLVTSEVDGRELEGTTRQQGVEPGGFPRGRVAVIPNGVDLHYFSPSCKERQPKTIVFTGKMSYHANITAVLSFVKEVMPIIWRRLPDTRFWIVGKNPPREVRRLEGAADGRQIVVTGAVEDIRPFLRRATAAVAPIRYGAGIQNKVLEAMACGTPVVATSQAAAALRADHGKQFLVADSPPDLASAVIAVMNDPDLGLRLGEAGRSYVERHHDWNVMGQRLAAVYRESISDLSCPSSQQTQVQ